MSPLKTTQEDLLKKFIEMSNALPNNENLIGVFETFFHAYELGSYDLPTQIMTAYSEFARRNNLDNGDVLNTNPSTLLLLCGLHAFSKQIEQKMEKKYDHFLQEMGIIFLGLEVGARPSVEIFQMRYKGSFQNELQISFAVPPFQKFQSKTLEKNPIIGHLSNRTLHFQPFISANLVDISSPNSGSNTHLRLSLTFSGKDVPGKFSPIPAFFWMGSEFHTYRLLWLLKNSVIQGSNLSIHFPMYDFSYPKIAIHTPYKYAWRNLDPYPFVLDFFVELHGIQKSDFFKQEKKWVAEYDIFLEDYIVPETSWENSFFIHAFPMFYWNDEEAYKEDRKIRFYQDANRAIWIRTGKEDWQIPTPIFFTDLYGQGTGWLEESDENKIDIHILPPRKDHLLYEKSNISIHAVFANETTKEDEEFGCSFFEDNPLLANGMEYRRLLSSENYPPLQYQPRWNWTKEKTKFWELLARSFHQANNDTLIAKNLQDYLEQRLEIYSQFLEKIHVVQRSLIYTRSKLLPCACLQIRIKKISGKKYLEIKSIVLGVIWRVVDRFYAYFSERLPPNLSIQIELLYSDSTTPEYVWLPDDVS